MLAMLSLSIALPMCTEQELEVFGTCDAMKVYRKDMLDCVAEEARMYFCHRPGCKSLLASGQYLADFAPDCATEENSSTSVKMEVLETADEMAKLWASECLSSSLRSKADNASRTRLLRVLHE